MTDATEHITPSARALRLKERLLGSPYEIDIERAVFYTEVFCREVRVSGYCAYFTDLGTSIQNDTIARTNFNGL